MTIYSPLQMCQNEPIYEIKNMMWFEEFEGHSEEKRASIIMKILPSQKEKIIKYFYAN